MIMKRAVFLSFFLRDIFGLPGRWHASLPQSVSALCRTIRAWSVQRYLRKVGDFLSCCFLDYRQHDERLLSLLGIDRYVFPLQGDAQGHMGCGRFLSRMGGLESKQSGSHSYRRGCRLSSADGSAGMLVFLFCSTRPFSTSIIQELQTVNI